MYGFWGMCEFWTVCEFCEFYFGIFMEPRIKSDLSPSSGVLGCSTLTYISQNIHIRSIYNSLGAWERALIDRDQKLFNFYSIFLWEDTNFRNLLYSPTVVVYYAIAKTTKTLSAIGFTRNFHHYTYTKEMFLLQNYQEQFPTLYSIIASAWRWVWVY